jgi:hypothetical protein
MDDFIAALIVVFILLIILIAAAVWFPYYPEGVPEEERVVHSFSPGKLGFSENYVSRVQEYGDFGVGVPQDEELKSAPRMEITAGIFGGASESFTITVPDYIEEWVKGGEITFTVEDTNKYGNLVIRWNGDELYNGKAYEGDHEVEISPSKVKKENTLDVLAGGPGLMFWAATVYSIKDFKVNAKYGPAKFVDLAVSQDELETLDRFELLWYTKSRRGNLSVKINGEEIYNMYPDRDEVVAFKDSDLTDAVIRPGNNRVTFTAINGSFELDDVLVNTHVSKGQRTLREKVDIAEVDLEKMKRMGATLRLYVKKVEKSGRISITINEQSAGSAEGREGWVSLKLNTDLLEAGSSWIGISSTGAFEISEAKVEIG